MASKKLKASNDGKDESLRIRANPAEKQAWEAAAKKDSRSLSNWVRLVINRAAGYSDPSEKR